MADYGNNFVQLHNHTHYSLLDGASKIPDLAKRAAELGMPAVGITDHGNMHGAYEMYTNCVANGVKPIIGIEAYVTPETARQDKSRVHWGTEAQRRDDVSGGGLITHLTMWAENDEGLVNLIKASSVANLEGRVMRYPRMDKEVLATYSKGVIASSGCPSGIIQTRLRLGQFDEALRAAGEFQDIFGKDNFFIELMDHGLTIETQVTNDLLTIAKKLDAPLLATNDSHYVHAEDAQAQDAMLCINSGSRLDDPDRFKFDGTGYYIKTAEEMRELFKDHPDACDNTLVIAERCNVMFDDHEDGAFMPKFPCPEGWDETSLFLKKVEEGLEKRYDGNPPLDVLKQLMSLTGWMLMLQPSAHFSREAAAMTDFSEQPDTPGPQPRQGAKASSGSERENREFSPASSGPTLPVSAVTVEEGMLSLAEAEELEAAVLPEEVLQPASTPHSRAAQTSRERIRLRIIGKPPFIVFRPICRRNCSGTFLVYCSAGLLSIGVRRTIFHPGCANYTNFCLFFSVGRD